MPLADIMRDVGKNTHQSTLSVLCACILAFFMVTADASALNVALPQMHHDFPGSSVMSLQWIIDSYTLMFAACMLSAGAFSDRVGARNALVIGLAFFVLAACGRGLSPDLVMVIGCRIVQGLAAAVIVPSSLALIRQTIINPGSRARAIALWTASGALAIAIGSVVGGLLITACGWRFIFLISLPVGLLGIFLLRATSSSPRFCVPFDISGQLSGAIALSSVTYAVIAGGHHGFHGAPVIAVGICLISVMSFIFLEKYLPHPMLPLSLFGHRGVAIPMLIGFSCNMAFFGAVFILSLFFHDQQGQSALQSGIMFVPMAASSMVCNYFSTYAVHVWGTIKVTVSGLAIMAIGCGSLSCINSDTSIWNIMAMMILLGIGSALVIPALTTLILECVDSSRAGTAAAIFNTSRQMGGAMGIAIFGVLLAKNFTTGIIQSFTLAAVLLIIISGVAAMFLPRRAGA